MTERTRPEPIFIAVMLTVKRLRIAYLHEEINPVDEVKRDQIIREAIQTHYRERHGRVPAFGKITGYFIVNVPGFGAMDFGAPMTDTAHRSAT